MNVCVICAAIIDVEYNSHAWTFIIKKLQEKKKTLPTLLNFLHMRNINPGISFFGLSMKHGKIGKIVWYQTE
jgi:hypothetical protein